MNLLRARPHDDLAGVKGWGAAGDLDLGLIDSLVKGKPKTVSDE